MVEDLLAAGMHAGRLIVHQLAYLRALLVNQLPPALLGELENALLDDQFCI